jgi:hypothetical protein
MLKADEIGRAVSAKAWWRARREWPADLHFADGRTEEVMDRELPRRPLGSSYGCASGSCAEV